MPTLRRGSRTVIVRTADGRAYVWCGIDAGQLSDCMDRVRALTAARIVEVVSVPDLSSGR